eukprot:scaffold2805_cov202-Prasinococcus_capsulatus_cf.AAC.9
MREAGGAHGARLRRSWRAWLLCGCGWGAARRVADRGNVAAAGAVAQRGPESGRRPTPSRSGDVRPGHPVRFRKSEDSHPLAGPFRGPASATVGARFWALRGRFSGPAAPLLGPDRAIGAGELRGAGGHARPDIHRPMKISDGWKLATLSA